MAGLLGDVLPWMYSQSNTIKKNVKGLLNDPAAFIGSLGQDIQTQNDQRKADYRTLMEPGVFTSEAEKSAAINRAAQEAVNYAAPTVWHGSPHKFDKFDSSKIGTGEGAQAYGHGLYVAESPGVAKTYADMAATRDISFEQAADALWPLLRKSSPFADDTITFGPLQSRMNKEQFIARYMQNPDDTWSRLSPQMRSAVEDALKGHLYKVDLPDDAIARMLDWDKPLSQQAPEVQKILETEAAKIAAKKSAVARASFNAKLAAKGLPPRFTESAPVSDVSGWTGQQFHSAVENMLGGKVGVSEYLRAQGIPGIRYLDQGSRGTGTGTSNYVVFPGEEGLLKILERNGQPVAKKGGLLNTAAMKIDQTTGLPLNPDGTVTLFHGTTKAGADSIRKTGMLKSAGEPHVYLTTDKAAGGYGDGSVVPIRIDPKKLRIDDEFPDGRKDFAVSVGKPGGALRVLLGD